MSGCDGISVLIGGKTAACCDDDDGGGALKLILGLLNEDPLDEVGDRGCIME